MNELHPRYMFMRPSRSILIQNAAVPWASRGAVATDAHRGQPKGILKRGLPIHPNQETEIS